MWFHCQMGPVTQEGWGSCQEVPVGYLSKPWCLTSPKKTSVDKQILLRAKRVSELQQRWALETMSYRHAQRKSKFNSYAGDQNNLTTQVRMLNTVLMLLVKCFWKHHQKCYFFSFSPLHPRILFFSFPIFLQFILLYRSFREVVITV